MYNFDKPTPIFSEQAGTMRLIAHQKLGFWALSCTSHDLLKPMGAWQHPTPSYLEFAFNKSGSYQIEG